MYQPSSKSHNYSSRYIPPRSRSKWKLWLVLGIAIVCLLAFVIVPLWFWPRSAIPNYVGLNGDMVVQVQIKSTKIPYLLNVQLITFNTDHKPSKPINCYIMQGQKLTIQGDILNFAPWLDRFGLHSGYKLTQLAGCYSDTTLKNKLALSDLNGGEDSFFATVQEYTWYSQLVEAQAHYSKPISVLANLPVGQTIETFYVYTTPKGLSVLPSK